MLTLDHHRRAPLSVHRFARSDAAADRHLLVALAPVLALPAPFVSLTAAEGEISLVAPAGAELPVAPQSTEGPWDWFRVRGPLDFGMTGVISKLSSVLADAGIPLFVVSTFDTDFVLVSSAKSALAAQAWRATDGVEVVDCD
ncbi:hypothetical protein HK105_205410 [Polyrhizophydium stewartii]|uniref:CASTOR ACT domain-containing protein n=1 Tax=Polyrhizophydium stewartii TaxID=2732419 RepID=A0ABR4N6B8_9FUNG|nr:hypothetical protein HK105_006098 [Polyrhizophydium stewartii]